MGRVRLKLEGFVVLLGTTLFAFIVHVLIESMQKIKIPYLAAHTYTLNTSITAYLCVPLIRSLPPFRIASASFYLIR